MKSIKIFNKQTHLKIKKIIIFTIIFLSINYIEAEAKSFLKINPEWEEYLKLTEEEKSKLEVIPEQYIYDYEYNTNLLTPYSNNTLNSINSTEQEFFNLYDVEGKKYANDIKENQSSLGLCWNFAGQGSAESNILIKGVTGLDSAIAKCNENPTSNFCKYKKDYDTNYNYINGMTDSNVLFSKRYIDYIRAKPSNAPAYNNSATTFTPILEEYNPYTYNSSLGAGGSFGTVLDYYSQGIAPLKTIGVWDTYKTTHETYSLKDIFLSETGDYQVLNAYYYPTKPYNLNNFEIWKQNLKELIVKYGAAYISTNVPDSRSGSCFYNDTSYETTINGITKNVKLINNTGNCGKSESHALQIIGWDDNYTFGYCKTDSTSNSGYDKTTCTENGYTWTEGKGAWILKNSWGASSSSIFPYLSYNSTGFSIYGFREIGIKDYDNVYDKTTALETNNNYTFESNNETYIENIYRIIKPEDEEYLNKINFYSTITDTKYEIYASNDNVNYQLIDTINTDYVGLYTADGNNFKINGDRIFIKIRYLKYNNYNNNISYINVFTNNKCSLNNTCLNTPTIKTTIGSKIIENGTTNFNIYSKTSNIESGTQLKYKIFNSNNEEITNKFSITSNYVINNKSKGNLILKESIPDGEYKIKSYYNEIEEEDIFYIRTTKIDLTLNDKIFYSEGKVSINDPKNEVDNNIRVNLSISTTEGLLSENWTSSDESIATIDNDGYLTINNTGHTIITYTNSMLSGEYSKSIDLYVYEPIYNVEEFLSKLYNSSSNNRAYYLMNDLDFTNVSFPDITNTNFSFSGILDGNQCTLKNITKEGRTIGLFNNTNNATIMNLRIENSNFKGTTNVGSIVGTATNNTVIKNIYNSASVNSENYAGGIAGKITDSIIENTQNVGEINTISSTRFTYAGGIVGYAGTSKIKNSFNEGKVYSNSNRNAEIEVFAAGIVSSSTNSTIENCYNIGSILSESSVETANVLSAGIYLPMNSNITNNILNTYFLENNSYNFLNETEKTLSELQTQITYENWDFDNIWYIKETDTPKLKVLKTKELENIELVLNKKYLNLNNEYYFDFNIFPINSANKNDITITSSNSKIFEINDNKIITKDQTGTAEIIFTYNDQQFKYKIEVKELYKINYNKSWTNLDLPINLNLNYADLSENEYIKLIYNANNIIKEVNFDLNKSIIEYNFNIIQNTDLYITFNVCNNISCQEIINNNYTINNIDKEKPYFSYTVNNINKILNINIKDELSGLSNTNIYEYSISSSDKISPELFNNYIINKDITNPIINYQNKYLWIKNISDNANNYLCDGLYCVYDMNLSKIKYKVHYYDEDRTTLLKEEEYEEDSELNIKYIPKKSNCDKYYICSFDKWIGYEPGMTVQKDLNLYASYKVKLEEYNITTTLDDYTLSYNTEYIFDYNTEPPEIKELINIKELKSSDESIFRVVDNKIITGNKAGTAKLIIKTNEKTFEFQLEVKMNEIYSNEYKINDPYIKVKGLLTKYSTIKFKNNIYNDENYKLFYKNSEIVNEDYIRTNMIYINELKKYYIVLMGDINEDGVITAMDYIKIKNHIMRTNTITDKILLMAADIDEDEKITAMDYIKIKNHIMNGDN